MLIDIYLIYIHLITIKKTDKTQRKKRKSFKKSQNNLFTNRMINVKKKEVFISHLYYQYIEILKTKQKKGFSSEVLVHRHHIEPVHDGGDPKGEIVLCTIKDHARAHYIRYKVYNQIYDYCAYCGLVGKKDEMQKSIQKKIVQTNRERGNVMFNKDWQKEMANRPKSSYYFQENPKFAKQMASKGGKIGGKIMTNKKKEVLKENGFNVGTNYGRIGGLKHQHPETKRRLGLHLEWLHDSGIFIVSHPCESVKELTNYLNCAVPNSIRSSSGLSEILRGVSTKRFGWKLIRELDF